MIFTSLSIVLSKVFYNRRMKKDKFWFFRKKVEKMKIAISR